MLAMRRKPVVRNGSRENKEGTTGLQKLAVTSNVHPTPKKQPGVGRSTGQLEGPDFGPLALGSEHPAISAKVHCEQGKVVPTKRCPNCRYINSISILLVLSHCVLRVVGYAAGDGHHLCGYHRN